MRTFDLTPLLRSSVGFDRLQRALDGASNVNPAANSYPPYDIESFEDDKYRVTLAVAGFTQDDIDITVTENSLVVEGKAASNGEAESRFLHRGIARRAFERKFELAEHVKVTGASLTNGLLFIDLVREVPQALKPRKIAINNDVTSAALETNKAA